MIPIKVKNPLYENSGETSENPYLEFKSKAKGIVFLVKAGISKPEICDLLKVTHQHIHIVVKQEKVNGNL